MKIAPVAATLFCFLASLVRGSSSFVRVEKSVSANAIEIGINNIDLNIDINSNKNKIIVDGGGGGKLDASTFQKNKKKRKRFLVLYNEVIIGGATGEPSDRDMDLIGKALEASYNNDVHWRESASIDVDADIDAGDGDVAGGGVVATNTMIYRSAVGLPGTSPLHRSREEHHSRNPHGAFVEYIEDDDDDDDARSGRGGGRSSTKAPDVFVVRTPVLRGYEADGRGGGSAGAGATCDDEDVEASFCRKIRSTGGSPYLRSARSCLLRSEGATRTIAYDEYYNHLSSSGGARVETVAGVTARIIWTGADPSAEDDPSGRAVELAGAFVASYNDLTWRSERFLAGATVTGYRKMGDGGGVLAVDLVAPVRAVVFQPGDGGGESGDAANLAATVCDGIRDRMTPATATAASCAIETRMME